ncbi:MCE family protein [Streptomyces sp. YIM 98790]|uniref:MCE family protein n=1 Tax=Streptomyces sp. YIM 98790 TaxID=2689077 RepID=UPI0014081FBE|nr:MCE family protein [Streptomyces sp. YIM 98790]
MTTRTGNPRPPRPRRRPARLRAAAHRHPATVGLAGLLALALCALGAYRADSLPLAGDATAYTADFAEAAGIRDGDEVRIAGVTVGEVTGVRLNGDRVTVSFTVRDAWVGNASTAGIALKTLLGSTYLALDPLGTAAQDPDETIPLTRTASPYDVTRAFEGLGETLGALDTDRLAESFRVMADTFRDTPADVATALEGLSALSGTIASRDTELAGLLEAGNQVAEDLAAQNATIETLLEDGNLLLGELSARRTAIHALLTGSTALGEQLGGLVEDNREQLGPTLEALDRITAVLEENQEHLDATLAAAGPYYRLLGNTLGSGRWFDLYLCGVVPPAYLPEGSTPASGCLPADTRGGGS